MLSNYSFLYTFNQHKSIFKYQIKGNKKRINVAGHMSLNEWRGKKNIEFMIEDISLI